MYEYKMIAGYSGHMEEVVNRLSKEGWRLCSSSHAYSMGNEERHTVWMERVKAPAR